MSTTRDNKIPIDLSLEPTLEEERVALKFNQNKRRLLYISVLAVVLGLLMSIVAKVLILLIYFITNLSYYGKFSFAQVDLIHNQIGLWVILIPAIGGLAAGLMAFYGSRGIQGHGIPEAMEQVLTNKSKISPIITLLKPISSAIVIGTGGPFGAEGPIISTGGALGSNFGEFLKITHNERKILLAAGAAAGMAAIFGTPIAGIFLAVELLLFEFSPRSLIPTTLACITATAGCHFLIRTGPIFPIHATIELASNNAIFIYSIMGLIMGVLSIVVTKGLYWIEDLFYKIPINWMWYPAIGGIVAGIFGYFSPRTLGVGYANISDILSGDMAVQAVLTLAVLKLFSWAISLSSGTSGGTLAPMMTIGGGIGATFGFLILHYFPDSGVTIPLSALVCMMAFFAGASRALLTSIIFGIESTGQFNGLLPLLAACSGSYVISFFFMKNTIMTEKIARRGVKTPDSYEPDVLEEITVGRVLNGDVVVIDSDNTVAKVQELLQEKRNIEQDFLIVTEAERTYKGMIRITDILECQDLTKTVLAAKLVKMPQVYVYEQDDLKEAMEMMAYQKVDVLPVIRHSSMELKGAISYHDIAEVIKNNADNDIVPQNGKSSRFKMSVGRRLFKNQHHGNPPAPNE